MPIPDDDDRPWCPTGHWLLYLRHEPLALQPITTLEARMIHRLVLDACFGCADELDPAERVAGRLCAACRASAPWRWN